MDRRALAAGLAAAFVAGAAQAQTAFCSGFEAGWEATFRNRNMIPAITPICPLPRIGGNTYEAGFERGMMAAMGYIAQRRGY